MATTVVAVAHASVVGSALNALVTVIANALKGRFRTNLRRKKMDDRPNVLDKLTKLQNRLHGKKGIWPPNQCSDVDTHLAGMYLREHIGLFIEALRRMD